MAINYLDKTGLAYFWDKIKSAFVAKDGNKVLSDQNYTTGDKNKVSQIRAIRSDELEEILV